MSRESSPETSPVKIGKFASSGRDFYAQVSGELIARDTPQEIEAHFASGTDQDQPADWFQAQLVHYGLPPYQTKLVARPRLLEAVNAGELKVPADLLETEATLKQYWTWKYYDLKNQRSTRRIIEAMEARKNEAFTSGTKRKATDDGRPAKKAKTTTSSDSDSERETSPDSSGSSVDSGDSPLNIWGESSDDDHDDGDDDLQDFDDHAALAPLGTVNGIYKIKCEYMKFMHGFSSKDLGLALRPVGSSLWAKFGLGFYEGVMYFEECPRESSGDQVWFKWRGRVEGGPIYHGDEHRGWIKFLGGGRISGWMEQFTFEGWHDPNQPPITRREFQEFRREWNSYTKARYDKEYRNYFSRFP